MMSVLRFVRRQSFGIAILDPVGSLFVFFVVVGLLAVSSWSFHQLPTTNDQRLSTND